MFFADFSICKTRDLFHLWHNVDSFAMLPPFQFYFILFSLSAAIVENMAEFRPGLCAEAAQQGLMQWLLKRIKVKVVPVKQEELKPKRSSKVCRRPTAFCSIAGLFRDGAEEGYFFF